VKSYHHPESENDWGYWGQVINGGIALLVIPRWDLQHYGFPLYLVILGVVLIALIRFKLGKKIKRI
jgi:hypothetical protein